MSLVMASLIAEARANSASCFLPPIVTNVATGDSSSAEFNSELARTDATASVDSPRAAYRSVEPPKSPVAFRAWLIAPPSHACCEAVAVCDATAARATEKPREPVIVVMWSAVGLRDPLRAAEAA